MDLWHLERLRLLRTHRLVMLLGVYGFFGVIGPLTARYLADILTSVGGAEMQGIVIPEPVPADGITQFISNAGQLGVLAVVVAAAGALAIDAKPELGVFLRTRVTSLWTIVTPRFVTVAVASVLALVAGTVVAAGLTGVLIGRSTRPRSPSGRPTAVSTWCSSWRSPRPSPAGPRRCSRPCW